MFQLHHFTRINAGHGYFPDDAFQIAHLSELLFNLRFQFQMPGEMLHNVKPVVDCRNFFQRKNNPAFQKARAHRRDGFVNYLHQRFCPFVDRIKQFEVANGEAVEPNVFVLLDARQTRNMAQIGMLREVKIMQDGARCNDPVIQALHPKPFQRFGFEMTQQAVERSIFGIHPVFERIRVKFSAK